MGGKKTSSKTYDHLVIRHILSTLLQKKKEENKRKKTKKTKEKKNVDVDVVNKQHSYHINSRKDLVMHVKAILYIEFLSKIIV